VPKPRTALLLILCFALPCIAQAQTAHLTAAEAKNHLGETATVCGHVASARFAEKSKGMPTFLYLDAAYPKQIFTIVIWGTDRPRFGTPERTYRDKNVCWHNNRSLRKTTNHSGQAKPDSNPKISASNYTSSNVPSCALTAKDAEATSAIPEFQRRDLLCGSAAHRLVPVHGLAGMLYSRYQTLCGITEPHCY